MTGVSRWRIDVRERVGDLLRADLDHVVLRAELLGDLALEGGLVVQRVAEGERERAQLMVGLLDGERGGQARVEAAREVAADRHVGPQPQPHRVAQQLAELLRSGLRGVDGVVRLPPRLLLEDLAVAPDERVPGRQQADALERAARRPRGPEREDLVDPLEIRHGLDDAGGEHALDLAREDDAAVGQRRVVQRAHAEAVAHQRQRARRGGRGARCPTGRCSGAGPPGRRGRAGAGGPRCRSSCGSARPGPRAPCAARSG